MSRCRAIFSTCCRSCARDNEPDPGGGQPQSRGRAADRRCGRRDAPRQDRRARAGRPGVRRAERRLYAASAGVLATLARRDCVTPRLILLWRPRPSLSYHPAKQGDCDAGFSRSSTAMCISRDPKRFGYAWMKNAPSLNRHVLPERSHQGGGTGQDRPLRLRRSRCRPAAASGRGRLDRRARARRTSAWPAWSRLCRSRRARRSSRRARSAHAQHKILRGIRRLIQNQSRSRFLHPARLHRRAEAAGAARPRLRHLHLPPSPAERDQDGEAMPRSALRARSHRQARHQGRHHRSVAAAHEGAGRAAQCPSARSPASPPKPITRAGPANSSKPYIAHAIDSFRLRPRDVWRRLACARSLPAPIRNGSRSSTGWSRARSADEKRKLFRDNAIRDSTASHERAGPALAAPRLQHRGDARPGARARCRGRCSISPMAAPRTSGRCGATKRPSTRSRCCRGR